MRTRIQEVNNITLLNGVLPRLEARDPGATGLKRGVRAAVVVPGAFAIATVASSDRQMGLFAAFGAFALLLFVDFPGGSKDRLRSYGLLVGVGAIFIVLGTVCSELPVAAVLVMAIVGFCVLYTGVVSVRVAAGTMAALLSFVLPVTVAAPPDQIPARLAGWLLAGALVIPAVLFVWPDPYHDDLRARLAGSARALATLTSAHADGKLDHTARSSAADALAGLRNRFEETTCRPTGAGASDAALSKLVSRMEWAGSNAFLSHDQGAALGLPHVCRLLARITDTLHLSARVIAGDRDAVIELENALVTLEIARRDCITASTGDGARALVAEERAGQAETTQRLHDLYDPAFRSRALSYAVETVAEGALESAGWERTGGAEGASHLMPRKGDWQSITGSLRSHLTLHSVWMRNSLRGAAGMALAVTVVEVTSVNHGFWVILGAISVLRSNALGTGKTALHAIGGTVVGFAVGAAVMVGVGDHHAWLWAILPVAVLVAGVAPSAISYAAGQAGFTVVVVILFNIIQPVGWKVGVTRVEDVSIGCAVSLGVGLLLWPRGATEALGRALGDAYARASEYLLAAVDQATSGEACPQSARRQFHSASDRLDDAYRQFLSERGTKRLSLPDVTDLFTGAIRTGMTAHSLSALPALDNSRSEEAVLVEARAALARAFEDAHRWYLELDAVLAGRGAAIPPVVWDDGRLRRDLVAAVGSSGQGRLTGRLLWAAEALHDQERLRRELARAAEPYARRCR